MIKLDLDRIAALINVEAAEIAHALSKIAPVASGSLRDSYTSKGRTEGDTVIGEVTAGPTHKHIVGGRGKNKPMPPVEQIRQWLRSKGESDVSGAYAIARKIGRDGIAPKDILSKVLAKRERIDRALRSIFGEQLGVIARDVFAEAWKQPRT